MSSQDICDIMAEQIKKFYPNADIYAIPVADGGEGSVNCFLTALGGKVVIGVSQRAKKLGVPTYAIVGGSEGDMTDVYKQGVSAVFSINRLPQDLSISKQFSKSNLAFTMENVLRLMKNE